MCYNATQSARDSSVKTLFSKTLNLICLGLIPDEKKYVVKSGAAMMTLSRTQVVCDRRERAKDVAQLHLNRLPGVGCEITPPRVSQPPPVPQQSPNFRPLCL